MSGSIVFSRALSLCLALSASSAAIAREESLASPDGHVVVAVSDMSPSGGYAAVLSPAP